MPRSIQSFIAVDVSPEAVSSCSCTSIPVARLDAFSLRLAPDVLSLPVQEVLEDERALVVELGRWGPSVTLQRGRQDVPSSADKLSPSLVDGAHCLNSV